MEINFKILSENNQQNDEDTFPIEQEKTFLLEALIDVYPYLPEELQRVGQKTVYVINHSFLPVTKLYMGWSAEDDFEYRPGDKKFYDPELPINDPANGTIKVSVTQKFIKTLAIGKILGEKSPVFKRAAQGFSRQLLAHELLHAYQYHTNPVYSLNSGDSKSNCPEGLCDKKILEDTKIKIQYEREAAVLEKQYIDASAFMSFADALDQYESEHPEDFKEGAKWWLVSKNTKVPLADYYFREKAKIVHLKQEFNSLSKLTYEGQIIPPQLVYDLKEVNDGLQEKLLSKEKATSVFQDIIKEWKKFCNPGTLDLYEKLIGILPYLAPVNERFKKEVVRFEKLDGL